MFKTLTQLAAGLVLTATLLGIGSAADADDASRTPIALPAGGELVDVDFERHVVSMLGRLGCNSAACHGSFQGKGGLRFSLFGQSPAADFAAILGEGGESRIDLKSPDDSLILIKATGGDGHGGKVRFTRDSWEYQIYRRWIADGARRDPDRGAIARLVLAPVEIPAFKVGASIDLRITAEFRDGTREDVTSFAEFRSRDDSLAVVNPLGKVRAQASGSTAIIVSYRGKFLGVPLFIPYPEEGSSAAKSASQTGPSANWIDEEINAQLARLNLSVSPPADDAEFLRRAMLDAIGLLPTSAEVQRFLADDDPHKRSKKIDSLLAHPRRAVAWASRLCEITACNVEHFGPADELRGRRAKMWHDWFRKRIADNMPYDQIVHGVLCAVSRRDQPIDDWLDEEIALEETAKAGFETPYQNRPSLDLFWRRVGPQGPLPVEDLAELTASAFLGLRLHCARCHQHPYDHWTQDDFAGYANIFARVEYGSSTELRLAVTARLESRRQARQAGTPTAPLPRVQEVFVNSKPRLLVDALAAAAVAPQPPGGPVFETAGDSREELFRWLTQPDNPYFAANIVNRVWARYFGSGLVEPVDSFSTANPASHPQLLTRLAEEFVHSGYDLRQLERLILNSEAFQRTSRPTGNNAVDQRNLAHALVRPLPAEVLVDSLNQALETSDNFGADVAPGSQALELATNRFGDPSVQSMFRVLGRAERTSFCECDAPAVSSVCRSLFVMSDPRVVAKIRQGRLARLLNENWSDSGIIGDFYLATLSRPPAAEEREFCVRHVAASESRATGLADVVWALINSREFTTNH
jgi:hypothetical protein